MEDDMIRWIRETQEAEYRQWRDKFPSFEIDGETLYGVGGDIPYDDEQLREIWVRDHGGGQWRNPED